MDFPALYAAMILIGVVGLLALPAFPAAGSSDWIRFLRAIAIAFVGIFLPLPVFFLDAILGTPDWKGACQCGWVDGFHLGKLALTPFVLWATASLHRVEIVPSFGAQPPRWSRIGLCCGAVISASLLLFWLFCVKFFLIGPPLAAWAAWYGWRAWQFFPDTRGALQGLLSMIPFWAGAAYWSHRVYQSLPDKQPQDCFVVTAATRGHSQLVGPFTAIEHNGRNVHANSQLLAFWQFEAAWRAKSPRSHRAFRRIYNRLGPHLAARIQTPWLADAVFLALKPIEWIATRCNHYHRD